MTTQTRITFKRDTEPNWLSTEHVWDVLADGDICNYTLEREGVGGEISLCTYGAFRRQVVAKLGTDVRSAKRQATALVRERLASLDGYELNLPLEAALEKEQREREARRRRLELQRRRREIEQEWRELKIEPSEPGQPADDNYDQGVMDHRLELMLEEQRLEAEERRLEQQEKDAGE